MGSWEALEDAFRANFQGTYVRPPDADDLSHITQQPGESARILWNRFHIKKNQIVDCPDAEALAAFKHSVRDEWLARHLGQEKPRTMAALTSLMTRFCAGEDSWLARSSTSDPNTSEPRYGNGKPRRKKEPRRIKENSPMSTTANTGFKSSQQNQKKPPPKTIGTSYPTSKKSWTKYVKSTALLGDLQTIPTEIVGSLSSPADSTPNTRGSTHQAKMTMHPTSRTPENKRSSHKKSRQ